MHKFMLSHGMQIRYLFLFIISFIPCTYVFAQEKAEDELRKGNELYYNKKDYPAAEKAYRKSLEYNGKSYQGHLNLGDALYQQRKYEESAEQFQEALKNTQDPKTLANAYFNLGNAYLQSGQADKAVEAYKNAAKRNPNDADIKYNYSKALEKKKEKKKRQQQQQSNGQKQNILEPAKPGKGKDSTIKKKAYGNQQQKDGQKPSGQLDPMEMERIMDALRRNENTIRQRMNRRNQNDRQNDTRKPW